MTAEVNWQLDKAKVNMDVVSGGAVERTKGRCINTKDPVRSRHRVRVILQDVVVMMGRDKERKSLY